MTFKFRVAKPRPTRWVTQKGSCAEDAVQQWHEDNCCRVSSCYKVYDEEGKREDHCYAVFELEDGTELVSLIYDCGIFRSGGVQRGPPRTLETVAAELGVDVSKLDPSRFYPTLNEE